MVGSKLGSSGGGGGSGDVVGPSSSTDNAIALFDSTTGKLLKAPAGLATVAGSTLNLGTTSAAGTIFLHDAQAVALSGVIIGVTGTNPRRTLTIITTGWTGNHSLSLPNADVTVVGVDTAQTLTNKTLTDPLFAGDAKFKGLTSSALPPSTDELPADKDFCIHKDTNLGTVTLSYNDGGVVKSATLA